MPEVQGLTPSVLWYTIVGIVGIGSLIVLWDKVNEAWRRMKKHPEDTLAESISQKVLSNLEPRFSEIDRKLAADKARLDEHSMSIGEHRSQLSAIEEGNKVMCRGILALLSNKINGNSDDKLRASQEEITNYLINK